MVADAPAEQTRPRRAPSLSVSEPGRHAPRRRLQPGIGDDLEDLGALGLDAGEQLVEARHARLAHAVVLDERTHGVPADTDAAEQADQARLHDGANILDAAALAQADRKA